MRSPETETTTTAESMSMEEAVQRLVKEAIEEASREGTYPETGGGRSGRGVLPLLLVGGALVAISYLVRNRDESLGETVEGASRRVQEVAETTSERTEEVSQRTGERVRQSGEEVGDRIEERGEEVGETVEETGSTAADRMEETAEEAEDDESGFGETTEE